jgi:ABC-type amino acid transport substrate-binding protein
MFSSTIRRAAVPAALIAAAALLITITAVSATGASQPQRRQIAAATLSRFRVIITATRGPGHPPMATVRAAGYQRSGNHWKLIAIKRIGKANQWFWFSVEACRLTIRQLKGVSPVRTVDSIKVSLLITPALGCSPTLAKRWRP